MPVVQAGRFPFGLGFDFNLKKNCDFESKVHFSLNFCPPLYLDWNFNFDSHFHFNANLGFALGMGMVLV